METTENISQDTRADIEFGTSPKRSRSANGSAAKISASSQQKFKYSRHFL
jgi:hypothetical protein